MKRLLKHKIALALITICMGVTGIAHASSTQPNVQVDKQALLEKAVANPTTDNVYNLMLQKATDIYAMQAMENDEDIAIDQAILENSKAYVTNLALYSEAPEAYKVLQDTKATAYQKAQLSVLISIDQQLKELNQNLSK